MSNRLSIVIPTFNSRKIVGETVRSSLAQTYPDIEVIIDDNASKDGTVEMLATQFGNDPRFRLFDNREDLNIPRGWNRGMGHASGDFLLLLHSDNLLHPRYAESVLSVIRRYDADVVYTECKYFPGETPPDLFDLNFQLRDLPVSLLTPGARAIDYIFRFQRMIPTSCVTVRKDCFAGRPPFDPQYLWDPDIELMTWLAKRYRVAHINLPLAAIRTHDGQASSWKDPTFSKQYERLLKLANREGGSEKHHFLLNWARSNQDVCERLSELKGVPWRNFLKYQFSWLRAEVSVFAHFSVTFLRKLKLIGRAWRTRWNHA